VCIYDCCCCCNTCRDLSALQFISAQMENLPRSESALDNLPGTQVVFEIYSTQLQARYQPIGFWGSGSRRRDARDAEGEGVRTGEGVSPSPADYGVWENVVSSQRGPGRPRRKTILLLSRRVRTPLGATFDVRRRKIKQ